MTISSVFAPPKFEGDEEKTRLAITLNAALWTGILLTVFVIIGNFIGGKIPIYANLLNLVFLFACFAIRYLMQQGFIKLASMITLVLGIFLITAGIMGLGTIRTPTTMAYMLVIIIAGLQFGRQGVLYTTFSISLVLLGLILAEQNNLLIQADYTVGITQWISYTIQFGLIGNLILVALRMIQRYLHRAEDEIERRKRVEETLRTFSYAIKHNPASIIITDPDGNIQEVNPKFEELTGYRFDEVRGKNLRILKSGTHSKMFYEDLWSTITSGKEWHGTFHNKKKNGDLYWEKASISPVFDDSGAVTQYIAVKEDITEQKIADEAQKIAHQKLEAQFKEINELHSSLRRQALRDPLTELYNRRYMDEALSREIARAKREDYPITIVLIDLDFLKNFNDAGGHATGDRALRSLAGLLTKSSRLEDIVCRFGGDEFIVILPNTTGENALMRTSQWHEELKEFTLLHRKNQILRITFSAGIATFPAHGQTVEGVLKSADSALYRAKKNGRNRTELFSLKEE